MSSVETNYFAARAAAERALAESSTNPVVAAIHEDMAILYEKLIAIDEAADVSTVTPFDRSRAASA